jgi:hypothetical protein
VRVAAANALSIVVSLCPQSSVSLIIAHVGALLQQQDIWDVRLSGMLGAKAIIRVCRANLNLSMAIIDLVSARLKDDDDDVRAIVTDAFSIALPAVAKERAELLPQICVFVWQALRNELGQEENSGKEENFQGAFTEPMLRLLASLYTTQQSLAWADGEPIAIEHFELLSKFTSDPRKHCRREAARSIQTLCSAYAKEADRVPAEWKLRALALPARFLYEALLLEREIDPTLGLQKSLGSAWEELLRLCGAQNVATSLASHVPGFLSMACTPIGSVMLMLSCDSAIDCF